MKVRLRLQERSVEGIRCPFPVVKLEVRDRYGGLAELFFRIDTQADFTSIPVQVARDEHIPFSEAQERTVFGLVGETRAYRDRVHLVIAGREYVWPCEFIAVPLSRTTRRHPDDFVAVLGGAGFLEEFAVTLDNGFLIITRLGPVRRMLRRWLHAFWTMTGMIHDLKKPL
jgi:hypothetical protein